jgi:simple sugar transport system permease protein
MKLSLQRRLYHSQRLLLASTLASVAAALVIGGLLLLLVGANPLEAYYLMLRGAFGDAAALTETLVKATPILLTGLSVALALRAGFWNIGAEGQLVMGGFAAAGVALFWTAHLPPQLVIPAVIIAGFVGGALWAGLTALLKVYLGVNEIVSTLMLNYIGVQWIEYLYFDAWRNPRGFGFPGTAEFAREAWLPRLSGRLHIGLILGLLACVLIWFVLWRTRWGYELRVIGASLLAARYSGMRIVRSVLLVSLLAGGLAGLAGMGEVAGISHRLQNGLAVGYGYTGLIVAFLARLNPLCVIVSAIFLAGLTVGSEQLQLTLNLPASFALILQGTILLFVVAGNILLNYRVALLRQPNVSERRLADGRSFH